MTIDQEVAVDQDQEMMIDPEVVVDQDQEMMTGPGVAVDQSQEIVIEVAIGLGAEEEVENLAVRQLENHGQNHQRIEEMRIGLDQKMIRVVIDNPNGKFVL